MLRLSLSLLVTAGCVDSAPDASPDGPTLPSDAYFIYDRIDDCLAQATNPRSCAFTVALCHNGRAAERIGDVIIDGDYVLDGPVARGSLREWTTDRPFELNLATGDAIGLGVAHYIPDLDRRWQTLQFDTIDCSQPKRP